MKLNANNILITPNDNLRQTKNTEWVYTAM